MSPLRNSGIRIFSYLDDYLICSSSREQALRDSTTVVNHLRTLGFSINWEKSRVDPAQCAEYLGLHIDSLSSRHTIREETNVSHAVSLPLQAGRDRIVQVMPTPAWPYGFGDISSTFGSSDDERFSALGRSTTSVLPSPPESQGESNTSVCYRSPPVVGAHGSDSGRPAGGGVVQGNHDNGRVLVRVGCDNDGQSSERHLESRSSSGSHKPPRTLGSVPCSTTLPTIYPGPPCLGNDRQFHCSGIHQPAGRHSSLKLHKLA